MESSGFEQTESDVAIIGSGVAGLGAGLYAARYGLKTTIYSDFFGGDTATAWTVENYPGFVEIDGFDLVTRMKEQVEKLGVLLVNDRVIGVNRNESGFVCSTQGGEQSQSKSIIFANGAARRKLGLEKEDQFAKGKGVHYCATCDGPLYRGKTIGMIGAGDSAVKGMNLAVEYASKIYSFVRGTRYTAEAISVERLNPYIESGKIESFFQAKVEKLLGEDRFSGVRLEDGREFYFDGLFIEIGAVPEVELAVSLGVALDSKGYIQVSNFMETNIAGVYAAGDNTNFFGSFKQIVTAAAMGSVAATSAFKYCK